MRLLVTVLTLLFFLSLLGFLMTNLGARVDVVVWNESYPEVPVYLLVILSAFAGCLVVGIIAVAEGANIRLANRRLRKEIQQLETEINYLRTQPPAGQPDEVSRPERPETARAGGRPQKDESSTPPTAPVYGPGEEDVDDPDDDVYSGGRAV